MKVAKMIDEDCAEIGPRKGKGENALCILGRLFTICLAIQEEFKGFEEFDEKFQGEIPKKLEWIRQGANDIFAYFEPKLDPKLEINKLVKKYNKLLRMEMRMDYDNFFLDNGPVKMREISEEVKPEMDISKIGRKIGEKLDNFEPTHSFKPIEEKPINFEPGHSFKPILRTNKRRIQGISFHDDKLEQLSNHLAKKPRNKI